MSAGRAAVLRSILARFEQAVGNQDHQSAGHDASAHVAGEQAALVFVNEMPELPEITFQDRVAKMTELNDRPRRGSPRQPEFGHGPRRRRMPGHVPDP
jgi:hypothetical protein